MMQYLMKCGAKSLTRNIVLAAFLGCAAPAVRADCLPMPAGVVAWWPAEGNANDQIGTNNGTLRGQATYAPGEVGQAFSLNGYNGGILVPDAPALRFTNAMTIEAWVYPNAYGGSSTCEIVSKWFGNGSQESYTTSIDPSGLAYFLVSSDGTATTPGIDYTTVYTTDTVPLNQWSHFAATYDGAALKVYLNGVLENQAAWTQGIFPGTAPLLIGSTYVASVFNGLIDETTLYNRALSDAEVQEIYNAGSAGKCGLPPVILAQPQSQTVVAGTWVSLSAAVGGTPPLTCQWRLSGTNVAGATNTTLTFTNVQTSQAGTYSLQVTNLYGATNSADAVLTVNPPPPCLACPAGVAAWWSGEGDASDQAGTNNGTLRGGVTFGPGQVGQAFSFDGASGSVLVPDSPALRFTNAMTVEAWINPKSWGGTTREIVSKWFGGASQQSYTTSIDTSGRAYVLVSNDGRTSASNVDYMVVFSPNTVPTNQWTHFAATYDGSSLKLYLNGALQSQAPWTGGIFPGTAPLAIGAANSQSFFNGMIDEPTLYNRALSLAEIQAIYNAVASGKCGLPPSIVVPPKSQAVRPGTNVSFSVLASGRQPFSYQWMLNGVSLSGTTNASLTLSNVQPSNAGSYSVNVTNAIATATSSAAVLKVNVVFAFGNGLPLTNAQTSFSGPVTVQLQNAYTNGLIFFTLDGSTPTFASTLYTGPFVVSQSVVLRALGYSADFFQSGQLDPTTVLIVPVYSLTPATSGGGSIAFNPAGGSYLSNTVVSVTATPASGWTFLQWMGDLTGANPVASVTMGGNRRVTAVFGTTLGTTAAGNGSVALSPPGGLYPYGSVVALTAIPQAGNYFGLWGNAASGNVNPLYFTVTNASPTVSCLFASLAGGQAALVVTPSGHGKVTVNPRANVYTVGAGVILTATPDAGQSFLGWTGDASGTSNPLGITMNQSRVITANFTRKPTLSANTSLGGLTGQGFQLFLDGELGGVYRVDSSTGLVNWLPLMTVTNLYGKVQCVDPAGTNAPRRFYRAMQLP
jgi:hypothetical protein